MSYWNNDEEARPALFSDLVEFQIIKILQIIFFYYQLG